MEQMGGAMLADSLGEVQMRVREQLLQGASQIKVMGGGGVYGSGTDQQSSVPLGRRAASANVRPQRAAGVAGSPVRCAGPSARGPARRRPP